MANELAKAKENVRQLLDLTGGDGDAVYGALLRAERAARQFDGYTDEHADEYAMQRLALADLTGNPAYRS